MSKSKALKTVGAIAAMTLVPVVASAQTADSTKTELPESTASNIEWHFTKGGPDKARINLFYNLPLNARGYSFMEFYGKGGYFGKDMINIPLDLALLKKAGVELKAETKHALFINPGQDNVYFNTIGLGLEKSANLPGGVFASVKFLPVVFGKNGLEESAVLGYFASKSFEINRKLSIDITSFLDFDIAAKGGPKCDYGETHVTGYLKTKHGKFYVGTGLNHNVSGELAPDNQLIVKMGYHPKK